MQDPPSHLWREWSSQSHGLNTAHHFAPSSVLVPNPRNIIPDPSTTGTPSITAAELKSVLAGHHNPRNRFTFFSDTLTFSLQFAAQKKADGRTENRITCLNTSTARDEHGKRIKFYHIPDLIRMTGMPTRTNRDGKAIDYAGEWVAIDCHIYAGAGTSTVSFDILILHGLYSLSPELGLQAGRSIVHIYSALQSLRSFWFESGKCWELTESEMAIAIRLAAAFEGLNCAGVVSVGRQVQNHLVAWFLAMRNRAEGSVRTVLRQTLESTAKSGVGMQWRGLGNTVQEELTTTGPRSSSSGVIDLTSDDEDTVTPLWNRRLFATSTTTISSLLTSDTGIQRSSVTYKSTIGNHGPPETRQYEALMAILATGELRLQASDLTATINPSTIKEDLAAWQTWFWASRARDRDSGDGQRSRARDGRKVARSGRIEKKDRYGKRRPRIDRPCRSFKRGDRKQRDGTARGFQHGVSRDERRPRR